jgi:hypothetical protein
MVPAYAALAKLKATEDAIATPIDRKLSMIMILYITQMTCFLGITLPPADHIHNTDSEHARG